MSDRCCRMEDLSLEVGEVDDVPVHHADGADAGCGQIETGRRSQSAGADKQYFGLAQLELAFAAAVLQDDVAAITFDLLLGQFHALFHDVQFDRIDDAAFVAEPLKRTLDLSGLAGEFDVDPPGRLTNIGAAHVGDDVVFPADLINDRFLDLVFRKPDVETEVCHYRPPAMAGTIDTSSPALSEVSFPFKNRMSSSLT